MKNTEYSSLSSPALLQKIDRLREQNIGEHDVPLPQLVVVGDQSSGKSSLLESLTGIPFPRNVELCTRHATQITSRRDNESRVEIRIIPGPGASDEHKDCLESYIHTVPSGKDLRSQFLDVLRKANDSMGIRQDMSSKSGTIFSEDILKIEIYGPRENYLTVIDVPGIFRNHAEGITTKDDIRLVNSLVRRYIKDQRTIILAVLPSNVDIATQEIIELAEEYDKLGERTLGVLTKPDLVTESTAKISVCNLVCGNRRPLALGYYIVRNRGADDPERVEHDTLETIFQQEPWSVLPRERVGIGALRKQLGTLLAQITHREFPNLRKEINDKLAQCQNDLDNLGPARPGEREQRGYLTAIARNFEGLTRGSLNAQYSHNRFFEKPEMRLITQLVNLTGGFSDSFQKFGQLRHFEDIECMPPSSSIDEYSEPEDLPVTKPRPLRLLDYMRTYLGAGSIILDDYPELGDIIPERTQIQRPKYDIMQWIEDLYFHSRGMDLGCFSTDLLSVAFVEQTRQWEQMVRVYMGEVIRYIHHFVITAIRTVCVDDSIVKGIWSAILDSLIQRYKSGLDQAILLVSIERHQRPFTLNCTFNEEVQAAQGKRMKEILKPKAWVNKNKYGDEKMVINLDDVLHTTTAKTNVQHLQEEIHDKLRSYYHLAVDRFIDNIFRQAIGHHLLFGPSSPLNVFSQEWVINLEADELELIAGEKEAAKLRRQELMKKRKDLKTALDILKI